MGNARCREFEDKSSIDLSMWRSMGPKPSYLERPFSRTELS
jgi:hypothetical protein